MVSAASSRTDLRYFGKMPQKMKGYIVEHCKRDNQDGCSEIFLLKLLDNNFRQCLANLHECNERD